MSSPCNSASSNPTGVGSEADSQPLSGRYRFCAGWPVDPSEGLHPELADTAQAVPLAAGIPSSPQELIAIVQQQLYQLLLQRFGLGPITAMADQINATPQFADADRREKQRPILLACF